MKKSQFSNRLANLKKDNFGALICQRGRGLLTYKEKMLRGYVRLQAEAHGLTLSGEAIQKEERPTIHTPVSVRAGYHASKIPPGVKFRGER